jgi:hypothetical protein
MKNFRKYSVVLFVIVMMPFQRPARAQEVRRITTIDSLQKLGKDRKKFVQFNNSFESTDFVYVEVDQAKKRLEFANCKFSNLFELSGVIHEHGLVMRTCEFVEGADFSYSSFSDSVVLDHVIFLKNPKFTNCTLPDSIHLENVEFNGGELVDFSSCQLRKNASKCVLQLSNTPVYKIVLPYDLFQFDQSIEEQYDESVAISIYESLIRNCKEAHLTQSAERWDIEYQQYRNRARFGILGSAFNYLQEKWWNFGYDRDRVLFVWLPTWFFIFFMINYIFLNPLLEIYNDEEIRKSFAEEKKRIGKRRRFIYAMIYTSVIYFSPKLSISAMSFKHLGVLSYIFFIYLMGTLHVVIGIAGFISMGVSN